MGHRQDTRAIQRAAAYAVTLAAAALLWVFLAATSAQADGPDVTGPQPAEQVAERGPAPSTLAAATGAVDEVTAPARREGGEATAPVRRAVGEVVRPAQDRAVEVVERSVEEVPDATQSVEAVVPASPADRVVQEGLDTAEAAVGAAEDGVADAVDAVDAVGTVSTGSAHSEAEPDRAGEAAASHRGTTRADRSARNRPADRRAAAEQGPAVDARAGAPLETRRPIAHPVAGPCVAPDGRAHLVVSTAVDSTSAQPDGVPTSPAAAGSCGSSGAAAASAPATLPNRLGDPAFPLTGQVEAARHGRPLPPDLSPGSTPD